MVALGVIVRMRKLRIPILSPPGLPIARLAVRQVRGDGCFPVVAAPGEEAVDQRVANEIWRAHADVCAWWP